MSSHLQHCKQKSAKPQNSDVLAHLRGFCETIFFYRALQRNKISGLSKAADWHANCFCICMICDTIIRPLFAALLPAAALVVAVLAPAMASDTRETAKFRHVCANAVAASEARHNIPDKLLAAISHAESGRWSDANGATIAWPWTVTAEGTGHFLPSRAAAIAKVEALRARGVSSIDVGCMQVNLHYHPDAFETLSAAFDPAVNTAYAGQFLAALKRETGSWNAAAARYHSATHKYARPYLAKVMRLWHAARNGAAAGSGTSTATTAQAAAKAEDEAQAAMARRRAADAHREAVIAAYMARRAERYAAAN